MKICVAGGGSTYTPELVDRILRRRDRLPAGELALLTNPLGPDASLAPRVWERLRTDNEGLLGRLDG